MMNNGRPDAKTTSSSLPFPRPQGGDEYVEAARRANLAARADLMVQRRRTRPTDADRLDRLERQVEALIATIAEMAVRS